MKTEKQPSKKVEAAIIYNDIDVIRNAILESLERTQADIEALLDFVEQERKISDERFNKIKELSVENAMLRKQVGLKPKVSEKSELENVYQKLKYLRKEKVEFEKKLDECIDFCQSQYDDLK